MTEPTIINVNPEPGKHQAIAIMMLINGILDALAGASLVGGLLISIIGILCLPVAMLPLALGVFEIIYASKMLSHKPVNPTTIQTIAIIEVASILFGNVVGMVVGILNLVFLDDPAVKQYMRS
jgi:hypothetical protein